VRRSPCFDRVVEGENAPVSISVGYIFWLGESRVLRKSGCLRLKVCDEMFTMVSGQLNVKGVKRTNQVVILKELNI
jgi:hypothetical protein